MLAGLDNRLEGVLDRAHQLAALDQRVRTLLPPSLAPHCKLANVRRGRVILLTESAALRSRLRFMVPQLIRRLRQEPGLSDIQDIELRVVPPVEPRKSPYRRTSMSADAARILKASAEATEDPELRRVLERLASRRKD